MKSNFFCVFDLVPNYSSDQPEDKTFTLEKLATCETELAARKFIDDRDTGFGLCIIEVWE